MDETRHRLTCRRRPGHPLKSLVGHPARSHQALQIGDSSVGPERGRDKEDFAGGEQHLPVGQGEVWHCAVHPHVLETDRSDPRVGRVARSNKTGPGFGGRVLFQPLALVEGALV